MIRLLVFKITVLVSLIAIMFFSFFSEINDFADPVQMKQLVTEGALLLDVNNGEVISLVSLPNFDINKRENILDKKYINKITKGVYELGSIFKTFTIALALENDLVTPETIIEDIPRSLKCSIHKISDMKEHPKNLSVEEILVRSSNDAFTTC